MFIGKIVRGYVETLDDHPELLDMVSASDEDPDKEKFTYDEVSNS